MPHFLRSAVLLNLDQLTTLRVRVQLVEVDFHLKKNLSMVVEYAAFATDTIDRNA